MRFIVQVSLPAHTFNAALRDGSAARKMARILEDTKPEAAYFTSKDGKRGGYLVYNLSQASEMPRGSPSPSSSVSRRPSNSCRS